MFTQVKVWFQNRRTKYKRDKTREEEVQQTSGSKDLSSCNNIMRLLHPPVPPPTSSAPAAVPPQISLPLPTVPSVSVPVPHYPLMNHNMEYPGNLPPSLPASRAGGGGWMGMNPVQALSFAPVLSGSRPPVGHGLYHGNRA